MKLFTFIMAALVLWLSWLPCADIAHAGNAGEEESAVLTGKSSENQESQTDNCSPFCHCTCCAAFTANHQLAAVSKPLAFNTISYTSYLTENLFGFSVAVWQPPRLA